MVASRGRMGRNLVHAMNEEWDGMAEVATGEQGELVQDWAGRHRALAGCRTAADVLARVQAHPDAVLGVLIGLDHESDRPERSLAGRIVLQAMLGKMVLMAHRDPMADVDDYVAQLCCRLRSYPLDRRPRRIAANLALDTLKAVHAERPPRPDADVAGPRTSAEPWDELAEDQPDRPVDLSAVRVLRAATELGLIDDSTHWLLAAVYADGWSGKEVAAQLKVSHATVRFRCSRAVRGLAREAVTLAAAARADATQAWSLRSEAMLSPTSGEAA